MILTANAEGGSNGSDVIAGTDFDTSSLGTGGTNTYSSDIAIHGNLVYKTVAGTGGQSAFLGWDVSLPGAMTDIWTRMYAYVAVNYNGQISQLRYLGIPILRIILNNTNNIRLTDQANVAIAISSTVVPLNTVFRIEAHVMTSASPTGGTVEVRIFLNPESTVPTEVMGPYTGIQTASSIDAVWFGPTGSAGAVVYHDDDAISTDDWLGPANAAPIAWYYR